MEAMNTVLKRQVCTQCQHGGVLVSYGDRPCLDSGRNIRVRGRSVIGIGFKRMVMWGSEWRELWVNEAAKSALSREQKYLEIEVLEVLP